MFQLSSTCKVFQKCESNQIVIKIDVLEALENHEVILAQRFLIILLDKTGVHVSLFC